MLKKLKKINMLLDHTQRVRMVFLVILMLISAFLETLGIALIVPIMSVIVDPVSISQNKYHMGDLYNALHFSSTTDFAVFMMIGLVLVFVVKNIILFLSNKAQLKFIYTNQFDTSNRMMINF
ncbi:MAG: ABC transporter ATP-binding protein, partial [Lachnospiraceae bacterium]|nr:ABC transporter ATP-binding protein [Lachnospiraceae bacterium]